MKVRELYRLPEIAFDDWLPTIKLTAAEYFAELGIEGTKEEIQATYAAAVDHVKELGIHPTLYSDAPEVFEQLVAEGVRLAVLSSHPESHIHKEAEIFGVQQHLRPIKGDCHDKAIGIREIMDMLKIQNPRSVLYVGDTIYDIRAAKLARVVSAGIATGYMNAVRLQMEEPDYFFYSLSDIPKVCQTKDH